MSEREPRWDNKRAYREEGRGYDVERNVRRRGGDNYRNDCYGRGDDYYGPSDDYRGRGEEEAEWRCLECGTRNYERDYECYHCGCQKHHGNNNEDDDLDEFGRNKKEKPTETRIRWPPPFESGGAAYVFDARSGMFYDATADFFYDPRTKYYYGNKTKKYYSYTPGQQPPFTELDTPVSQQEDGKSSKVKAEGQQTKKIAISLKTTTLPEGDSKTSKKKAKTPKTAALPDGDGKKKGRAPQLPSKVEKQHSVNINKWSERSKEIRHETAAALPKTAEGKPVCLLCRRKFPNAEKLKQHEEKSALHKENLQKQAAKQQEMEAKSQEYRDRAQERRFMHGPEAPTASLVSLPRDDQATAETFVRPQDNLGASNIGNQMLQKLGWKSGNSLGRGNAPAAEGGAVAGDSKNIVKDWEKIEALAATGSNKPYSRMNAGQGGSGIGN